ncbi:MAG: DNA gyrase C-terminal beta-propeller domain-containing protein, partial [Clostridiales bacterium]
GGLILGTEGIRSAYRTGRGAVKLRAKCIIEQMSNGKQRIVINELPYQVNKANLVEKIAELVRDKKLDGITDLRDESDKDGMRVVIELRKDANASVLLNQLYKHTQLQTTFGVIMLALVDGEPKVLTLKEMMEAYVKHQKDVVARRCRFDLAKAQDRAHIVEGLKIALDYIDEVIATIRASHDNAKEKLMERFSLSERQAQAILEMRLRALQGMEREKLDAEYRELIKTIAHLTEILGNEKLVMCVIKDELAVLRDKHGDARRTVITRDTSELSAEDLIAEEDMVITITNSGYIKRLSTNTYRQQRRGGRGVTAMTTKQEDFVEQLFITTTHHYLMVFTRKGRVYRLKVHEIPEAGRQAKGTAIVNLLSLTGEDTVTAVIPVREFPSDEYLFMATAKGVVKKSVLSEYDTNEEIVLSTTSGAAIRFSEEDVRPMGRATRGVRGITLDYKDYVVCMDKVQENGELLVLSENGYGKRTPLQDFRTTHRGGKGIYAMRCNEKTGSLVSIEVVRPGDEMMIISREGIIIRVEVDGISEQGRYAQGVRVIKLSEGDTVVDMAKVLSKDDEEEDPDNVQTTLGDI